MNSKDCRDNTGNTLRRVIIEIGDRIRVMIRRKIRVECDRQFQFIGTLYQLMNRQKAQHRCKTKGIRQNHQGFVHPKFALNT